MAGLAGKAEFMNPFGTAVVNHSGTFNGSVMACAATTATVKLLAASPPYADLQVRGTRLQEGIRRWGSEHGLELNVQGLPMAFRVGFGRGPVMDYAGLFGLDLARYNAFSAVLVQHGVWATGRGIWYLSAAHTDDDIEETLRRVSAAMAASASA